MKASILHITSDSSVIANSSCFIAARSSITDVGHFFSITPRVMQWSDNTYILDLRPVIQYWSQIAANQNISLNELMASIIKHPQCNSTIAAKASHPWQSVILLSIIESRDTLSFIDGNIALGKKLMTEVRWLHWLEDFHILKTHLVKTNDHKKKTSIPTTSSLEKSISRLGFRSIGEMIHVTPESMQRRFGKTIAMAWEWTWNYNKEPQQTDFLQDLFIPSTHHQIFNDDFPWIKVNESENPHINRHIDNPIKTWDQIEPLLKEDLEKICALACWSSSERVVSLEWELSFSSQPPLHIPVLFRHPHSLHSESGHHKTTLLQAFHSWQNSLNPSKNPGDPEIYYLDEEGITEWKLSIHEKIIISPNIHGLFNNESNSDLKKLQTIENSIPINLIEYAMTTNFCPENSFEDSASSKTIFFDSFCRQTTDSRRPLFMFDQPNKIKDRHRSSGLMFCERVGTSWWFDNAFNAASASCRDYYLRMTDDGCLQWVYKTDDDAFYLHGLYG